MGSVRAGMPFGSVVYVPLTALTAMNLKCEILFFYSISISKHSTVQILFIISNLYRWQGHQTSNTISAVTTNFAIVWDIAPCSPHLNRRFRGFYHFHLQERILYICILSHIAISLSLSLKFRKEDQPSKKPACNRWLAVTFLRNVGPHTDYIFGAFGIPVQSTDYSFH
jgi:hypothetical protein